MPAKSKVQQKLFGLALSVKRGETPRSKVGRVVKKLADEMSEKELEKYASVSRKKLPNRLERQLETLISKVNKLLK